MKKILVVDDAEEVVELIRHMLQGQGYEVITAPDGPAALEAARKEAPDLIILDLMLPRLNGYKICRMLKFDKKYRHIPVIICTARYSETDEKLGYEVGADYYFSKPIDAQPLIDKIKELIR